MRELAGLAGVSPATVSRVVNGRPEVSERVRESVLRVAREQGYPTTRTRAAGGYQSTGLVAVTLPLVHHSYFSEILAGASEAFYEYGMSIVLTPTLHEHDREVSLLERLTRGLTDGALLILPEESERELSLLDEQHYPFVIVDPHTAPSERVPTVAAANVAGARQATEHLLGLGHRRIAVITGPPRWIATEERLRGYRGALADRGMFADPQLSVTSDFSLDGGRSAAQVLLAQPEPPSAIFAFNDMLAIGALQAARAQHLEVPSELSVVGFDDTFEASIVEPRLTTVRQPLKEMGRMAVAQLTRLLRRGQIEALHVQLETTLVVRDSTGPPSR